MSYAFPVLASNMKSNPHKPDNPIRRTTLSTAVEISEFSIKRTTVACPVALPLRSTSKCRLAKTVPFQQATVLVASCPSTKACAFTVDRCRNSDGQSKVRSWSTKARLSALAKTGGDCSFRNAHCASAIVRTIRTPSPPEVPSALSTIGRPERATQFLRASCVLTIWVPGTRIPSSRASSMNAVLECTIGKDSGDPSERSIRIPSDDSSAAEWPEYSFRRRYSSCKCQVARSSPGKTRSGFATAIAWANDRRGAKPS
jgi:hypothetical protein